jgi:sigma-B regulation protein RsbU (phosphoserine phosphatase)
MPATPSLDGIKPSELPAPPEAAIQIMQACSREDVKQQELTDLAGYDPVVSAELLRVVNSPLYGLSREVNSIARAVNIIGHRALRNLALCIAVRDALKPDGLNDFDAASYWEDTLRRAVAARLLGQHAGVEADESFTAGLLLDFGLLVLFYKQPGQAKHWNEIRRLDPDKRLIKEQALFGITHDQVGELLSRAWQLPEKFISALSEHHRISELTADDESARLGRVLYCTDWTAFVFSADDPQWAIDRCRKVLAETLGINREQSETCLAQIPVQASEAAEALGLRVPPQEDFEALLHKANLQLAEENLSYQELTWRLEKALKERDALAEELSNELELAREIQRSLLPGLMPPDFPAIGINIPARQLSGDFFDYFRLRDGRIYFNLADVSGKGMNAALLMAKTSSLFRCLGKQIHHPAQLLTQINEEIFETASHGMFVTMVAGLFDPASGELQVVNAGHLPALLCNTNGKVSKISAQAPPLGILPAVAFQALDIRLDQRWIYMFSDGVTEAHTQKGEVLGLHGLVNMISRFADLPPRKRLESIVNQLKGGRESLHDDMTLLLLQPSAN